MFLAVRLTNAPYGGLAKAWLRMRDAMGEDGQPAEPLLAGLTPHGLRHAFSVEQPMTSATLRPP